MLQVVYPKGTNRYVVRWRLSQTEAAIQTVAQWAADPDIWLTWFDASRIARQIRRRAKRVRRRMIRKLAREKPR